MYVFVWCSLIFTLVSNIWAVYHPPSVVTIAFEAYNITPEVVRHAPTDFAQVEFPSGVQAILGNLLTPCQAKNQPTVSWPANPFVFYTLAYVDPDAVMIDDPARFQFLHWLVGNIPGDKMNCGELLASYYPPTPPADSGLHRYTFLIFEQKHWINFTEPRILQMTTENRTNYSIYGFSQKYKLGAPMAGNFFLSQFSNEVC